MILRNFIVLEGIDGAGTTTQAKLLKERLGDSVVITAEPTTGEIGKFLRRVLSGEVPAVPQAVANLFAADRAQHLYGAEGIVEMAKTRLVVSDRYLFSSLVYQGDVPNVRQINGVFPLPEILFYLRITGDEAWKRIQQRTGQTGQKTEIFEKCDTLCRLSAAYDSVVAEYRDKTTEIASVYDIAMTSVPPLRNEGMQIVTLDATQTPEAIAQTIAETLESRHIASSR